MIINRKSKWGAGSGLGRVLVTNKGRYWGISDGKTMEKGRRGRGEEVWMVMSVFWAQKSTGMKGKYSLTATINPYRRKKEEGGRKSGVR